MVLIVDFLNGYALGERAVAVRSGDGGDLVLARLEQRFCNVLSNLATCLWFWSIIKASRSGVGLFIPCTYPDDGDILDIVLEALRLVFCILLCHGIKGLRVDVNGFNGRRKIETCMRFTQAFQSLLPSRASSEGTRFVRFMFTFWFAHERNQSSVIASLSPPCYSNSQAMRNVKEA